jgi:hypothetical protein
LMESDAFMVTSMELVRPVPTTNPHLFHKGLQLLPGHCFVGIEEPAAVIPPRLHDPLGRRNASPCHARGDLIAFIISPEETL